MAGSSLFNLLQYAISYHTALTKLLNSYIKSFRVVETNCTNAKYNKNVKQSSFKAETLPNQLKVEFNNTKAITINLNIK